MDVTNFVQTGGFPVKTERLQELQSAYAIFNELGNLAGNLTIISGCVVVGTNVSDGYVFINGEVLKFKAGFVSTNIIIVQNESAKEFENGSVKAVHFERYATFGTAETSWLWSEFKRPDPIIVLMAKLAILEKKTAVFQAGGGMVLWNKPAIDIPTGWAEVVDWRGRMPVGFDATQTEFDTMGKIGGLKSVTGSAAIPIGGYSSNENTSGGTAGRLIISTGANEIGESLESVKKASAAPNVSITINPLNPYRTVLFIEYTL